MLESVEEIEIIPRRRLNNAEKTRMTKDHNGFQKLLIVLTKVGKRFALHYGYGRILCSQLLPTFQKSKECQYPSVLKFFPWRVPHQHALYESPTILIMRKYGVGPDDTRIISL